jgi:2-keto-4-pentenoate hydratase/2-oxohepta-3-ene-1,7-dioic acid hydratase in catechol pathway
MTFELKKNGDIVQIGHTELMIHKPQEILSEIFTFMSLDDGDIVMTGTPKGVGTIDKGDVFSSTVKNNEQIIIEETWVAV